MSIAGKLKRIQLHSMSTLVNVCLAVLFLQMIGELNLFYSCSCSSWTWDIWGANVGVISNRKHKCADHILSPKSTVFYSKSIHTVELVHRQCHWLSVLVWRWRHGLCLLRQRWRVPVPAAQRHELTAVRAVRWWRELSVRCVLNWLAHWTTQHAVESWCKNFEFFTSIILWLIKWG